MSRLKNLPSSSRESKIKHKNAFQTLNKSSPFILLVILDSIGSQTTRIKEKTHSSQSST
jgi:hypothetical protein